MSDGLQVERLTAEELASLDGHMLIVLLAEVCAEMTSLARVSRMARHILVDAQKKLNRDPKDNECKDAVLDAKLALLDISDRSRTLRDYKSILQTILRGTPV